MDAKKVKKAVFPVAGLGTRFLPATKAMPKELLPILDKPLIQYAVEEVIKADFDTLVFVTGRHKRAIEDHFDSNFELEYALESQEKFEQLEKVKNIVPKGVACVFVRQAEQLGLGDAVLCAEKVIGDEPFAVILADDFIKDNEDGPTSELVNSFANSGKSQILVMEVQGAEISKYGVVESINNQGLISGLVEKPDFQDAPSNLASIGRYVLTPDIFEIIKNLKPGSEGEIQLADAINIQASRGNVESRLLKGKRFDCGSVKGFFEASLYLAQERGYLEEKSF